jgi:hypothetical protein
VKFHADYSRVGEALGDEPTRDCILEIQDRMRTGEVIGADETVLADAAELHPGADRDLVRAFFTYRPRGVGAGPD